MLNRNQSTFSFSSKFSNISQQKKITVSIHQNNVKQYYTLPSGELMGECWLVLAALDCRHKVRCWRIHIYRPDFTNCLHFSRRLQPPLSPIFITSFGLHSSMQHICKRLSTSCSDTNLECNTFHFRQHTHVLMQSSWSTEIQFVFIIKSSVEC